MILTRTECAKYGEAIIVAVFTDRISAYAVQKNASGISLLASATENQEEGEMNEEKIRFNCQKAMQAMPREQLFAQRPVIFLLDPAFSDCTFVSVDAKREHKDVPISDGEMKAITEKYYGRGKGSESSFRNFPMEYLVDGFAVPQPLFLNGQDVTAHILSVTVPKSLEAVFREAASSHGLAYAGAMNICQLISEMPLFAEAADGIAVALFQNETVLLLMRNKRCSGIGNVSGGYGILEQDAAKSFSIGTQEAKNILRIWRYAQTDEKVTGAIDRIAQRNVLELTERLKKALKGLDAERLLPGAFAVLQFGYLTQPAQGLSGSAEWLADAPVARGAHIVRIGDSAAGINDPKGILKDHPESAADSFLINSVLQ